MPQFDSGPRDPHSLAPEDQDTGTDYELSVTLPSRKKCTNLAQESINYTASLHGHGGEHLSGVLRGHEHHIIEQRDFLKVLRGETRMK